LLAILTKRGQQIAFASSHAPLAMMLIDTPAFVQKSAVLDAR